MSSSSSSFPQLFASQLSSQSFSPLPSLLSELYAQPDVTLLLLPVGSEATASPRASVTSLAIAFQACLRHLEKCWRGQEKT